MVGVLYVLAWCMFDGVVSVGDAIDVYSVDNEVSLVLLWWVHIVCGKEEVFSGSW